MVSSSEEGSSSVHKTPFDQSYL